jgi:acetoin utilization deacetylase AcuC-like enzyme
VIPKRPAFIWSPDYEANIGRHVFPTQKFRLLKEMLVKRGLIGEHEVLLAPPASDAELLTVLDPRYLADMRTYVHTPRTKRSELPINKSIIESMVVTAGGTLLGAREALRRGAACHLGGGYHHGFPDHAEGFCYINDVAVAVASLRREGLVNRVAIIDTDVHQGNGTAACFRKVPEVFTFSIHQEMLYPYDKETSSLDIGMKPQPGAKAYLDALQRGIDAAIIEHKPELVIHVAGVDVYKDDQLGSMGLDMQAIRWRDEKVAQAALERGIPLLTVVAGGYARNTNDTVRLHAQTVEVTLETLRALE